jgi:antirestriction protein ArdA
MEVRIFVRNIESGKGEWFDLPVTEDDVREKLGDPEGDFEYEVEASEGLELEGVNDIDKINDFVEELENYDSDIVEALIESGYDTIKALEDINIEECTLYEGVEDGYDLGKYIIENIYGGISEVSEKTLENYFDYGKFGDDVDLEVIGHYCNKGYIQLP